MKLKKKKKHKTDFSEQDPRMETKLISPPDGQADVPRENPFSDPAISRLEELKNEAHEADEENQFMRPKKRGRPKGSKNTKETDGSSETPLRRLDPERVKLNKNLVAPLWEMVSDVGVRIAEDKKAAIGAPEMLILVETSARCIEQYLPDLLGEHSDLIVLTVTFSQWGLRVYLLRQANLERMYEEKRMRQAAGIPPESVVENRVN